MENQNQQTQVSQFPNQMPSPVNTPGGSKVIAIILGIVFVLVAIGAYLLGTRQSQPVVQNSVQTTPIPSPTPDPTANWKTYSNSELGISFRYPTEWDELQEDEELCLFDSGSRREYNNQPCVHIMLIIPMYNKSFLAAKSILTAKYGPGRGAYWGDRFSMGAQSGVTADNFINTYCAKFKSYRCSKETNANGISYIKSLEDEQVIESKRKAFYYSVLNRSNNFPIVLLSTQGLLDSVTPEESERILDQILSTFKLTQIVGLSATPSPSLHIYKDAEILYSVSYPSGWTLKRTYGKDISKIAPTDVLSGIQIDNPSSTNTFVLNVIDKKDTSSLVGWWNKYSPSRSINEPLTKANFSFKGQDAIKKSYTPGGNPPSRVGDEIYLLWNGYIYFFSWNYSPGTSDADLQAIANSVQLP